MEADEELRKIARNIRKKIIKMSLIGGASHIGTALSCVEILVTLYFHIMNVDPRRPSYSERDRFIMSKGHGCAALYATLAEKEFFSNDMLEKYYIDGGMLPGHVTKDSVPGIEVSSGSLGHGLSIGIGMALAAKIDKKKYRVFVLIGDGECNEGAIWEGAIFAAMHKLDNLIVIVDYNKLQAFGYTNEVLNLEPFGKKWEAFGWCVEEVDGHNIEQLIEVLTKIPKEKNKPLVIIAHTIKGKGVSFMENRLEWHYKSLTESIASAALDDIENE